MRIHYLLPLLFVSCSQLLTPYNEPCPAYATGIIPMGEYDPNYIECGVWIEGPDCYWWVTSDKQDALEMWAVITHRPMYFEMNQDFRYAIRADDGFKYTFWSLSGRFNGMVTASDTAYNITCERKLNRMPL